MDSKASEMCYPRTSFTLPCDRVSVSESVTESYDGITAKCSFTDGYGRVEVRALLCPMLCIVLCGSPHCVGNHCEERKSFRSSFLLNILALAPYLSGDFSVLKVTVASTVIILAIYNLKNLPMVLASVKIGLM